MKKYLVYFGVGFGIFLIFSIILGFTLGNKDKSEEVYNEVEIAERVEKVLRSKEWKEITENDKITLAFSSETETVSFIKNYLKDNKMAIFYVFGGPFDAKMEGNYIICTGFNEKGMAKLYYSNDDYSKEYEYSFEGLLEFSHKVLTFEM